MPINPEGGFETELERDIRMSRKRYANRVYTNANKSLVDQRFQVFHCKRCTSYVLITDADIQAAPRRRTDNAIVFCPEKHFVKLRTKPVVEPVKVRRLKGIETQYFHACADCGLHIAYQSAPHNQSVKNTSPAAFSREAASSTPSTTASPASAASVSPSSVPSAAAALPHSACSTVALDEVRPLSVASGLAAPLLMTCTLEDESSSSTTSATAVPHTADDRSAATDHVIKSAPALGASSHSISRTAVVASLPDAAPVSDVSMSRSLPAIKHAARTPSAVDDCALAMPADRTASSARSTPLIYLIETAVIFPTKATQIRLRCRICGFIPRNEIQFEEHKRDRGHWDQDSGQFSLQEESGDTPINPIIVG